MARNDNNQGATLEFGRVRCSGTRLENGDISWGFCEMERGRQRIKINISDGTLRTVEEAKLQISKQAPNIYGNSDHLEISQRQERQDSRASHICKHSWQRGLNAFDGEESAKPQKSIRSPVLVQGSG